VEETGLDENSNIRNEFIDFYLVSEYVDGGLAKDYLADNAEPEIAEKLVSEDIRIWQVLCIQMSVSFVI
jgi:hypothetical protein